MLSALVTLAGLAALGSAESDVLLKPIKTGETPVGIVLVQGAQIPVAAYIPLGVAIQQAAPFPVWISIPASTLDVPEPSAGPAVTRGLKALTAAGMPSDAKLVTAGHSLGGAQIQDWTYKNHAQVSAQVLMGAGLLRKYRNGTISTNYPTPTLGLGGTMDGLFRITRHAENYYAYDDTRSTGRDLDFPTVLFEGMTHMQFASGTPPSLVKANDLKPELDYDAAHAVAAETIAEFLGTKLLGNITAAFALSNRVANTGKIVAPITASQKMEAFSEIGMPCNSDFPLPSACPAYPRYPSGQQKGSNPADCVCGTPWSEKAQQIVAGAGTPIVVAAVDGVHPVSDITPIHLPHVWSNCSTAAGCKLQVTTVTYPVYSALNSLDTGFSYTSASELRTKLVSRQNLLTAAGGKGVNFTASDEVPSICAEINTQSWAWAMQAAGPAAAARFAKIGIPMAFGKDIFLGNAGPVWIENPIEYQMASDNSVLNVYSPCSHTPIDYPISSAAGFHYCKLVSPARALEWIYLDGLRTKGGL